MKAQKLKLKRVAIVAKRHAKEVRSVIRSLVRWLAKRGIDAILEDELAGHIRAKSETFPPGKVPRDSDMVIVLGGDGTLLSVARVMRSRQIPILGVNLGSLGFMTDVALKDLYPTLEAVIAGDVTVDERHRLRTELVRKGKVIASEAVLNDVVITKGAIARIIEVAVEIDGQFVTVVRADGLIVATPTGSTAYSLGAGGPILYPSLGAMILTPICPHTLTYRPVVVSDRARAELTLRGDPREVYVTFDGQESEPMQPGDVVTVRKSRSTVKLVSRADKNYFQILRHKLRWAERPRSRRATTPPRPS